MRDALCVARRVCGGFVVMVCLGAGAPLAFGQDARPPAPATDRSAGLTIEARLALIDALVEKWGPYVSTTFGVNVDAWRDRLVAGFTHADATNLREAVGRETYDGAMAALVGRGHRISDAPPAAERSGSADMPSGSGSRLGDVTADLAFTPVQPCRIVDTRNSVQGAIAAGATRSFFGISVPNYTSQGGSATDCGLSSQVATALAINVTAVAPAAAGYATVFPFNTTRPLAASLNYSAGDVVNNSAIAQIPNPLQTFDFSIYSLAQSHYVVDIVGYFAPNQATALQCIDTAVDESTIPNGAQIGVMAPSCPTGYVETATYCETSSGDVPLAYIRSGTCIAKNTTGTTHVIRGLRRCCRVPGR